MHIKEKAIFNHKSIAYQCNIIFFVGFPAYWYAIIGGSSACLLFAVMLVTCLLFYCYKQQKDSPIIHELVSIAAILTCDILSYYNFVPTVTNMITRKIKHFKKEVGVTIKSKETRVTTKSKETSTALHSYG